TALSALDRSEASSGLSSTTSRPPPSSGTRMMIPRPSLVTSSGPSPVLGFMAAMGVLLSVVGWSRPWSGLGPAGFGMVFVPFYARNAPARIRHRIRLVPRGPDPPRSHGPRHHQHHPDDQGEYPGDGAHPAHVPAPLLRPALGLHLGP